MDDVDGKLCSILDNIRGTSNIVNAVQLGYLLDSIVVERDKAISSLKRATKPKMKKLLRLKIDRLTKELEHIYQNQN